MSQVHAWLKDPSAPQVFRLFGSAGTGKTTLARYLAEGVEGRVVFAAYTGKAAYVLRTKGCPGATTIHSLAYVPKSKSAARLHQLRDTLARLTENDPARPGIERAIKEEEKNMGRPMFTLNLESDLRFAKLLVVDECSMVDGVMGADVESFGCKILVLGDPAQLPPVYGGGHWTEQKPDVFLTEIHRQARDNPIIELATMLREGSIPRSGMYGESAVLHKSEMTKELVMSVDQLIVGTNKTRRGFNSRVRELRGYTGDLPVAGDRVVCLRNNHEIGLLNGGLWTVGDSQPDHKEMKIDMTVTPEEGGEALPVQVHMQHFVGESIDWWAKSEADEFDYGYALTCHKSQGSQWKSVCVYDESFVSRGARFRWLYTALTRAAERVYLVRT